MHCISKIYINYSLKSTFAENYFTETQKNNYVSINLCPTTNNKLTNF